MVKDFLIIGDSNVTRHYTRLGYQVQNVSVVSARNDQEVNQALRDAINSSYKIVVFAFLTNLIISSGESGSTNPDRLSAITDLFNNIIPLIWYVCQLAKTWRCG